VIAPALALAVSLGAPPVPFGSADPPGTWELVWHDEFDATSIDASRWTVEDAAIMNNKELQYYTPEAVALRDGSLVIRADKRELRGRDYTSALLDTRAQFSMAFGRFECRAKLPRGQGMWPAFWMLPLEERWPPEIDILESLGHQPTRAYTTHHWGPEWPANQKTGGHFDGPDFTADFHVFSVEWTPERLDWSIDGVVRFTSTTNIPQDPMYLILNLAVGGNWPGNPDATTKFPQELVVDWVRAFRRNDPARAQLLVDAPHGAVSADPARWSFTPGEHATLRADPDIGYTFAGWSVDGADAGTREPVLRVEMTANRRVAARFEAAPDAPALLSRGRPVRASEHEGFGVEPQRAVDASLWSRWSADGPGPRWLEVDLGETHAIEAVAIRWTFGNEAPFRIEGSNDRAAWSTLYAAPNGSGRVARFRDLKGRARHVRFIADDPATKGVSLYTFDVYGR
jgi:beta-glucanase (GH16 family)